MSTNEANEPTDPTDLDAPDDHAGKTVDTPEHEAVLKAGHEPDDIQARPIILVGVMLVIVGILAYVIVTVVFEFIPSQHPVVPENAHPQAVEDNSIPRNERLAKIARNEEGQQPRLEALQRLEFGDDPQFYRSERPLKEGNPPRYHPEDMRADRVPELNRYQWVDKDKGLVRIPISEAMNLAMKKGLYKKAPEKEKESKEIKE